jgi:amidophosphoribosyltransferase
MLFSCSIRGKMSGIFGVVSKGDCILSLYYGTDYHSHLGTAYAGLAIVDGKGRLTKEIHDISNSQFKSKFYEFVDGVHSSLGIGAISSKDPQPLIFEGKFGPYAICCNGLITNKEPLVEELIRKGISFSDIENGEINTTELIAYLINQGDNIIDGIEKMYRQIEGSVSLLLLQKDGLYASRDKKGVSPLVIGEKENEVVVANETCSFPNLGIKIRKFMEAGEIVFINQKGIQQKREGNKMRKICAFLWIYGGFPASSYEGINAEIVRENCGMALAKKDNIKIDFVTGVPDSGVAHAIGYAIGSGKPFRRALVKYTPTYGRSYTPLSQDIRDRIALMKLIANEEVTKGNKIVVCEDSIVRGTQLKNYTITKIKDAGAKEVHARIACPPLMFPCIFNLSTRSLNELIARRAIRAIEGSDIEDVSEYLNPTSEKYAKMIDWIAKDLGVDSLNYLSIDDMVKAIGLPKEKLCLYCWVGKGSQKSLNSFKT